MSYLKNKKNRMKTKHANTLLRDCGIKLSDSPTNILVICNGGLCNGITYDMVCETFQKFGILENVIMVPGKCYSFVRFRKESDSVEAFDNLDGEIVWPEIKGPLYLGYVTDICPSLLQQDKKFQKPPGLVVIENFVTEEEENFILSLIEFNAEDKNSSELKHRKVKHFGYEFKYSINNVDLSDPIKEIPKELNFLWDRLKKQSDKCYIDYIPDQLTVNCYEPGQGIPPHVDTHSAFEDGIISLSLQSSIVMEFKNQNGITYSVFLPRRSLCIMLGESRYDWTHGITPRKSDIILTPEGGLTIQNRKTRTSLTFRKTRQGDCTCKFPRLCDSYLKSLQNSEKVISDLKINGLKEEIASALEESYVHGVYEKIAPHFSETRHKPWPNVVKFVKSFNKGSILVDVGCGNGKYFSKQNYCFEIGCDSSSNLIQICKQQSFECFLCNCLNIPIRDNVVDGCICIAVIHHLTTEERRKKAVKEIMRILRSGGRALIYVWAKNQEIESKKSSYLKQYNKKEKRKSDECDLQLVSLNNFEEKLVLPVHENRTNFNHNDMLVPWKLKGKASKSDESNESNVFLRFYHVFEDDELKNMCQELNDVEIIDYYYDQGNWCICLQKK